MNVGSTCMSSDGEGYAPAGSFEASLCLHEAEAKTLAQSDPLTKLPFSLSSAEIKRHDCQFHNAKKRDEKGTVSPWEASIVTFNPFPGAERK